MKREDTEYGKKMLTQSGKITGSGLIYQDEYGLTTSEAKYNNAPQESTEKRIWACRNLWYWICTWWHICEYNLTAFN